MKTFRLFKQNLAEAKLPAEPGDLIDLLLEISSNLLQLETSASSILTHLQAASGDGGSKFQQVYDKISKLSEETQDILKELREDITAGVLGSAMADKKVADDEEQKQAKLQSLKGNGPAAAKSGAQKKPNAAGGAKKLKVTNGGDKAPGKDLKSK